MQLVFLTEFFHLCTLLYARVELLSVMHALMCAALALQAFHKTLQDPSNNLASWKDNNPCGGWSYVFCSSPSGPSNITFVTEL
jgi:hypothetical protein